jgi:YYY domain-containing protein
LHEQPTRRQQPRRRRERRAALRSSGSGGVDARGRRQHATGSGAQAMAVPAQTPPLAQKHTVPVRTILAGGPKLLLGRLGARLRRLDWTFWALVAVALVALVPRLYGINWDANNHLHPDEREIVFKAICLSLPGTPRPAGCDPAYTGPGWFFSPNSPLNPHFFAYGTLPQYLLAAVAHLLAWVTTITHGHFSPADGGAWDDFNHFTLVGRAISAIFDAGTVLVAGLLGRRLAGPWAGLLAAALVAVIPFEVQVSHFYAVDTLLVFFVMLTLLGCVELAQGPRVRTAAALVAGDEPAPTPGFWHALRWGLLTGVGCGLAFAVKVSAAPLLVPIAIALLLRWRRRGFDEAALALLCTATVALAAFVITSPYALIDWPEFSAQVNEQAQLARGVLDYPYVRQFAGDQPFLYQLGQLLRFDMGWAAGLLGLAGFVWAATRLWRTLNNEWAIFVGWLVAYFAVIGSSYTQFSRYMLPVFAPLCVCGAAALVAASRWGTRRAAGEAGAREAALEAENGDSGNNGIRASYFPANLLRALRARVTFSIPARWVRTVCIALALLVVACSTFLTIALDNIYSQPNTRVQASAWIYNHVAPSSTITYEVWDDPLPVEVPPAYTRNGIGFTAAGHPIVPGAYQTVGLNLYDPDTPDKAQQMAEQLASAQVVVISSQRLLRSIPKLPDRYPMTIRYYQFLFAGKLGFSLAAHFENAPHLLGWQLNETGADESFSVYDHPPVWIFVKQGAGLSAPQIDTLLTAGLYLPPPSDRSGAQQSLLLSPQNAAADAQSPALYAQFPPNSLPNQIPLIWWLLAVELLGLAAFPLTFSVFPGLRDRGWGFAKLLGLLLLAWAIWLPSSLRLLPFDRGVVIGIFALLVLLGAGVAWLRRAALWAFVRERWRLLAVGEGLFVVGFLFFTWIRALDPDLWHIWRGGEKPMELAYLDGILRSRYMPPLDPWFAGGYINYYYYGQYLFAVLIKLTGIVPTTAFNLAIPLLFGMLVGGVFSIVAGLTGRWWAGLAGAFGMAMLCNLDGLRQLYGQWLSVAAHLAPPPFDYWASSRVIPYTINEFPFWSFLYGDLHAHLIDLPIVVLIAGCAASLIASARAGRARWLPAVPTLAAAALALGAAWCTNTWDLPAYSLLLAAALALCALPTLSLPARSEVSAAHEPAEAREDEARDSTAVVDPAPSPPSMLLRRAVRSLVPSYPDLRNYLVALALTFGAAYVLYLPFHSNFQNFVSGIGPVTTPTSPLLFFELFGVWLFLIASFFFVELYDRLAAIWARSEAPLWGTPARRLWLTLGIYCLVLLVGAALSLKSLLLLLLGLGCWLALDRRHSPARRFTYLTLLLGLSIAFGVELIYIRDFLDHTDYERMNTVFKFYYQVWTLFALGGALAFTQLVRRLFGRAFAVSPSPAPRRYDDDYASAAPEGAGNWSVVTASGALARARAARQSPFGTSILRGAWLLALLVLVLGSSVFLVEGTQARLQDPAIWAQVQPPPGGIQPQGLSLDGMAYMKGWYPGDYAAITWMNEHIAGDPTIIEASSGVYNWQGRVSIYTGLPAVVQEQHEYEQRYPQEVSARQADVETFWSTPDPAVAQNILREYGVRYVYFGALERTCFVKSGDTCVPMSAAAIAKFQILAAQGVLRAVYTNSDVTIYEVRG